MSHVSTSLIAIAAVLSAVAVTVQAQTDSPRTRAEVKAETVIAVRNGEIVNGERYSAPELANWRSEKTREQVLAEARDAGSNGEIVNGERHSAPELANWRSEKTRAQVVAETQEARRLGLMDGNAEAGLVIATPAQLEQIRLAGLHALHEPVAQARSN